MRKYRSWRKGGGLAGCAGARVERAGTRTYLSNVNVPFSHPSGDKPQKDGRKVRSRDEGTLTLGARRPLGSACAPSHPEEASGSCGRGLCDAPAGAR